VIFTFYSFKGGVGRSMALANVGAALAVRGLRTLVVDFDLEAPGLERYFPIDQEAARKTPGVIDLLNAFKASLAGTGNENDFRNLARFVVSVYPSIGGGGALSLMPAGRRDTSDAMRQYALNVRSFDWQDFYLHWEGAAFFDWLRQKLTTGAGAFDVVLVDSRTGVTEMGGICTHRLADAVVMMCAANHQNLSGTRSVADDFKAASVVSLRNERPLDLVIVPARIEQREPELLDNFTARFHSAFERDVPAAFKEVGVKFEDLAIPYEPEYAFEERVMSAPGSAASTGPIASAFEKVADALALLARDGKLKSLADTAAARLRSGSSAPATPGIRYDPTTRFAGSDVFLSFSREDGKAVQALAAALEKGGLSVFSFEQIPQGSRFEEALGQALLHCRSVLVLAGLHGINDYQKAEVARARSADRPVIPVLLPGSDSNVFSLALRGLADVAAFDLREGMSGDFESLPAFAALCDSIHKGAMSRRREAAADDSPEPYPGLRPFAENDRDIFFGRTQESKDLLARVEKSPVTVLSGSSGIGKTSLVLAGLFPLLRTDDERPWRIVHLDGRSTEVTAELDRIVSARSKNDGSDDSAERTLVFIDHVDGQLGGYGAFDHAFAKCLERAIEMARAAEGDVRLLIAARYFRLQLPHDSLRALDKALRDAHELDAPSPESLREAIERPALKAGCAFEPGLVERIAKDIESGDGRLSLLQLVMQELWRASERGFLVHRPYADFGGAAGVLAKQAEATFEELGAADAAAARALLLRLVVVRGGDGENPTAIAGQKSTLWEFISGQPSLGSNGARVLSLLADARVLTVRCRYSLYLSVSLSHPGLVMCWGRYGMWSDDHAAWLLERTNLEDATSSYELGHGELLTSRKLEGAANLARDRPDDLSPKEHRYLLLCLRARDRKKYALRLAAGTFILALIAAVGFVAEQKRVRERQQKALEANFAKEKERLLGEEKQRIDEENKRLEALQEKLREGDVAAAASALSLTLAANVADVTKPRVFVHYNDKRDAALVKELNATLSSGLAGFQVPPAEQRPEANCGEIRYFYAANASQSHELRKALTTFFEAHKLKIEIRLRDLSGKFSNVRVGTLEVWLPQLAGLRNLADKITNGKDGSEMRLVPGGCLVSGSAADARVALLNSLNESYAAQYDKERPPRDDIWLPPYYVDKYEVTNAQFEKYRSERYPAESCKRQGAACPNWVPTGGPSVPASKVPWTEADAFCGWAGSRLPTEEEWEKAARGIDGYIWPWGNDPDDTKYAGIKTTPKKAAIDVGSFPKGDSPYGISDLAGNLWELTGSAWSSDSHTMKGGCILNTIGTVRAAGRWASSRERTGAAYLGFRCARSALRDDPGAL
jgi:formylglycine-generating enzyme required for sulfatase activity